MFEPTEVFVGQSVTVKCGPPPAALNLGTDLTAEWRRNGDLINEDAEHTFSKNGGAANLTVSRFFTTDNGKKHYRSSIVQ